MTRRAWIAALVGAAAFLALTRGAILDPRDTGWLLSNPDSASAQLGWQFFRQGPLLQLPFGANPAYGLEIASSVVFSDSIPLAAFVFKPFSGALPAAFQYFGFWLAAAFVLQALVAYLLLLRFWPDRSAALIGSAFFLAAPPFLFRLGGHYALCGQWLVLAALYLYFSPRFRPVAWMLLLALSALVHFYLLAMVAAIWAGGDLWQRRWRGELSTHHALATLATGGVVTAAVLWFAGYFMAGAAAAAMPGFGTYRMNLLAPFDADGTWSLVLPDAPGGPGDFEGFNYLGTGMLLLAPLAAYALLVRRPVLERHTLVPIAAVCAILVAAAASNRVAIGTLEFFDYTVPELLEPFAGLVRGSGRLFWPVYYLLYVAILVLIFRTFPRRVALASCAFMLALQLVDSSRALRRAADRLAAAPQWISPLKSPLWEKLGSRYRRVAYVLPRNAHDAFLPWAVFAADHRMGLNFGYFARVDAEKLTAARIALEREIVEGRVRADTLYVFESAPLWNVALAQKRPTDVAGELDGFRILAPLLAECTACDVADVKAGGAAGYPLGERISFALNARGLRYATAGWGLPEEWGMRAKARAASVIVKLERAPASDLVLEVEARALRDEVRVGVSANGTPLGVLSFTARAAETRTARIAASMLSESKGLLVIGFEFPATVPDAFGLVALRLREP